MLLIETYLGPSAIDSIGCFAAQPVAKGTVVWALDRRLDRLISLAEFEALPAVIVTFLRTYAYLNNIDEQAVWILCGDHARHMNHADAPNLIESAADLEINIAARDIAAGEELTCNYFDFDAEAQSKLPGLARTSASRL